MRSTIPRFPIRAVARLTGLELDTLRAWERRYEAVQPTRDARGRLYSEADVHRLQLLGAAVDRGHSIGRVAALSDTKLEALLATTGAIDATRGSLADVAGGTLDLLLRPLERFDHDEVERQLNRLALAMPPRDLVTMVVLPFMRRVGDEWHAGRLSIAQEHLASAILRNLLGALVRIYARERPSRRLLFATPVGERHEFGILAAAMMAAAGGLGTLYLGPDIPARQIVDASTRAAVDVVVIGVVYVQRGRELQRPLEELAERLPPPAELWIGGALSKELDRAVAKHRVVRLADFAAFETQLMRLGAHF
jgi:DNA-binding transcriptional MerR regulator/methylmalonyl-CoA mutase cobalamin-binding subunit